MATAGTFVHSPLPSNQSIRLLKLQPSVRKNAPIICHIEHVEPDEAENTYEALSYAWGAAAGTMPISCNGQQLVVTENCLSALVRVRQPLSVRTLWINSICIDQRPTQDAIEERTKQIPLMGKIFGGASRVIVWLGHHGRGARRAMNVLQLAGYGKVKDGQLKQNGAIYRVFKNRMLDIATSRYCTEAQETVVRNSE